MRIVLIDDAQTMGREAGNSLLKILEEPPPNNLLLLIASDAEPMLDTIISRCQVIPFAPLTEEQAAQVIQQTIPSFLLKKCGQWPNSPVGVRAAQMLCIAAKFSVYIKNACAPY
ncbi:hypothetical protein VU05_04280 [Desulfobulbus sp. F1]|nr:hypothetical protein [Desulfobulbus sp. F1]